MNTSYKIVLLGAFVLFAAVVAYAILSGDGQDEVTLDDEYPEPRPRPAVVEPTQPPRVTLDTTPPPPPVEPPVEPTIEQETIGQRPSELPEAPVIQRQPDSDPLAVADPARDPFRRSPIVTEEPSTDEPAAEPTTPTETTEPGEGPRRAPVPTEGGETTETPTEPEPIVEPAPRPVPPTPTTVPRTYTVKAGDTFASIAEAFYGDESAWYDIAQANPSVDPKRLQVGQNIVLPNRDAAVREREEVQPPAPGKDQNYTVRPGDSLSKIASRFYGDSEKWDLIYARNRQLIGPRPDALKVGMELVIPQAYDGAN